MKSDTKSALLAKGDVALFTRAWIEIIKWNNMNAISVVALFTRAWIEIRMEKYINVYI